MCEELYENCPIRMYEYEFLADLINGLWGHFRDGLVSQISGSNRLSKIKNHPKRS